MANVTTSVGLTRFDIDSQFKITTLNENLDAIDSMLIKLVNLKDKTADMDDYSIADLAQMLRRYNEEDQTTLHNLLGQTRFDIAQDGSAKPVECRFIDYKRYKTSTGARAMVFQPVGKPNGGIGYNAAMGEFGNTISGKQTWPNTGEPRWMTSAQWTQLTSNFYSKGLIPTFRQQVNAAGMGFGSKPGVPIGFLDSNMPTSKYLRVDRPETNTVGFFLPSMREVKMFDQRNYNRNPAYVEEEAWFFINDHDMKSDKPGGAYISSTRESDANIGWGDNENGWLATTFGTAFEWYGGFVTEDDWYNQMDADEHKRIQELVLRRQIEDGYTMTEAGHPDSEYTYSNSPILRTQFWHAGWADSARTQVVLSNSGFCSPKINKRSAADVASGLAEYGSAMFVCDASVPMHVKPCIIFGPK